MQSGVMVPPWAANPYKLNLDQEEWLSFYRNDIYTQRFLSKWVYRGEDYTMICVDTHTDGNKFLQIFNNKKEIGLGGLA